MTPMQELNGPRALVCRREISGEQGGATVWCLVLADGFIIECGSGRHSMERATTLATIINEGGPEKLSAKALAEVIPVPF